MVDPQTTLGEQLLDLAIGQRKAQAPEGRSAWSHPRFIRCCGLPVNLLNQVEEWVEAGIKVL
jgi:hypothetical protein